MQMLRLKRWMNVPGTLQNGASGLAQPPLVQSDLGVIVEITGDLPGRLYVRSSAENFSQIAMSSFDHSLGMREM
ncbi:hypothetical protein [Alicyclobacillus fodiniaquatilis]|uniref:Uncharacterized protein n=1 Tax=Alicyclobacillus fodiniaquatilis TaxID=1661150 RepID=A0ABW4JHG7_9BACL